jgi:hypothetical protein
MLMDSEKPCKKKSASKRGPQCFKCNQYRHKHNMCMYQARRKVVYPSRSTPEEDVRVDIKADDMTLLEHITLLDQQEWTPPLCSKCGKVNANHNELECHQYEKCNCCSNTGLFGYIKQHICNPKADDSFDNYVDNNIGTDLYWDSYK